MPLVDTRIPLGFSPIDLGSPMGGAIQTYSQLMNAAQQTQQFNQQKALRETLAQPDAFNEQGKIAPDVMKKVMGIDPNAGMKIAQNQQMLDQHLLQVKGMEGDVYKQKMTTIGDTFSPILESYKENVEKGMPAQQAIRNAQKSYTEAREGLSGSGLLTPDEIKNLQPNFDPIHTENMVRGSRLYDTWLKERLATKREADIQKRSNELPLSDSKGNFAVLRPNASPNEQLTYVGGPNAGKPVPPDEVANFSPAGRGAGAKPAQAGSPSAIRASILNDVKNENEWKDKPQGQQSLEAFRRWREANKSKGGLEDDPEGLAYAAEFFKRTEKMPFGLGDKEDRDAVIKFLAHQEPDNPQWRLGDRSSANADQSGRVGQTIVNAATTGADTKSLGNITKQYDAVSGYEKGASKEFDLALSLMPKTPEPLDSQLLTQWVRTGSRQFGNVRNADFYAALASALDEYAKVISGGTGSAAASTDSARAQALSLIPPGATTAQIKGIKNPDGTVKEPGLIDTIKAGMNNKRAGYVEQIAEIKSRLKGQPATPESGGNQTQNEWQRIVANGKTYPRPKPEAIEMLKSGKLPASAFEEKAGPGSVARVLGAEAAAKALGGTQNTLSPEKPTTTIPPQAGPRQIYKLPPEHANDLDGTLYNGGTLVKRGNRIEVVQAAPAANGGDRYTALSRAKKAIEMGADRSAVEQTLRAAEYDPAELATIR